MQTRTEASIRYRVERMNEEYRYRIERRCEEEERQILVQDGEEG